MSGHFIYIVIFIFILVFIQSYVRFRFAPHVCSFPPSVVFPLSISFLFFVTFPPSVIFPLSITFLFFVTFPLSVVFPLSVSFLFFVTFPLWYGRSLFDVPIAYDCHVGT